MAGHGATWTDDDGHVWSGMPLWVLCGWVDDANKHDYGTDPFRDDLADAGYNVTVIDYGADGVKGTGDDFSTTFNSSFVKRNRNIIVADEIDGAPLPKDGKTWPLKLVGSALTSNKQRVGSIDEIVLTGEAIVVVPPEGDAAISLETGWNFVSVPKLLSAGNDIAMIFAGVDREQHSIWHITPRKDWRRWRRPIRFRLRATDLLGRQHKGPAAVQRRCDQDPARKMLARVERCRVQRHRTCHGT